MKYNLPNDSASYNNFTNELSEYKSLYGKKPRTDIGDIEFTSTSSNVTYKTSTYNSGAYADMGEAGMLLLLQDVLQEYLIFADDINTMNDNIGDLTALDTDDKSTIVAALNEIGSSLDTVNDEILPKLENLEKLQAYDMAIHDIEGHTSVPYSGMFYDLFYSGEPDNSIGVIDTACCLITSLVSAGDTQIEIDPTSSGLVSDRLYSFTISDGYNLQRFFATLSGTTLTSTTALGYSYAINSYVYRSLVDIDTVNHKATTKQIFGNDVSEFDVRINIENNIQAFDEVATWITCTSNLAITDISIAFGDSSNFDESIEFMDFQLLLNTSSDLQEVRAEIINNEEYSHAMIKFSFVEKLKYPMFSRGSSYQMCMYDVATDTWDETSGAIPSNSWSYPMIYNEKIYARGSDNKIVWIYDIASNTWDETSGDSVSYWGYPTLYNGKIYAQGSDYQLRIYDIATNMWSETHGNTVPSFWQYTVACEGKIYVRSSSYQFWIYDIATQTWDTTNGATASGYWSYPVAENGKIYVQGNNSQVWVYDVATNTWDETNSATTSNSWSYPFIYNGKIYARAYGNKGIWIYDIASDTWDETSGATPNGSFTYSTFEEVTNVDPVYIKSILGVTS